jgi:hypothetical protein
MLSCRRDGYQQGPGKPGLCDECFPEGVRRVGDGRSSSRTEKRLFPIDSVTEVVANLEAH